MKHAREDYARIQDPEGKIPADEPVFLLRGQDQLAPMTLRAYAEWLKNLGGEPHMVQSVLDHADAMDVWQRWNGLKLPDMPS